MKDILVIVMIVFAVSTHPACFAAAEPEGAPPPKAQPQDPQQRIERLEKQIDEMQRELRELKDALKKEKETPAPSAEPQEPPASRTASPDSLMNPKISVISDMVWQLNHNRDVDGGNAFRLRELELAFQSNIDPFSRADIYLGLHGHEFHACEAYATLYRLPLGAQARAGVYKISLGKANTLHQHELPWVDTPNALTNFVGEEGLKAAGISLSKSFELGSAYGEITLEGGNDHENTAFSGGESGKPVYAGKLRTYWDLSDTTNLDLGASHATGSRDADCLQLSRLTAVDATVRWRPAIAGKYHSLLLRGEIFQCQRQVPGADDDYARGYYLFGQYQMNRSWYVGARYDYSEFPLLPGLNEKALSGILTYYPSEFMTYRLQYKNTLGTGVRDRNELWLQMLFNIGPHGAHKF